MTQNQSKPRKKRMTKEQRAWCKNYEGATGFEPTMCDFENGNMTFYEAAREAVQWYEEHSIDALHSIDRNIPGYEEHHYGK